MISYLLSDNLHDKVTFNNPPTARTEISFEFLSAHFRFSLPLLKISQDVKTGEMNR